MLRVVTAFLLVIFAAGIAVEACALAASTSTPGVLPSATPTISLPAGPARTPSRTIEVPPPID